MLSRGFRRLAHGVLAASTLLCAATVGQAQTAPSANGAGAPFASALDTALRSPIVTLDKDRLFEGSRMGRAILARFQAASDLLIAENRRLEAALEEEERQLTERRKTLTPEEFRGLAQEFDTRVTELRTAQDAKSRALTRSRETDQQRFFEATVPILGQLMADLQAVAIIDRAAIILSFDKLDITDLAIARLDEALGDGPAPPPEEAPTEAPAEPPEPGAPATAPVTP